MISQQFLSKKRARCTSENKNMKMNDSKIEPELITRHLAKPLNNKISTVIQFKRTFPPPPPHATLPVRSSQTLFPILTHSEMKKAVFSYLTQREINALISSVKNKDFQAMVLKSSNQIITDSLSFKSNKTIYLNHSLHLNNSNNYFDLLFNRFPSSLSFKSSKFFIQIDEMQFFLETNTLFYFKANAPIIRNYRFANEFITHIQLVNKEEHLIAVFCFDTIKLFNYEERTIKEDDLPYSANYLVYNRELDMFVVTSDLAGTIFFHSNYDDSIRFELKLFTFGVDVIELNDTKRKFNCENGNRIVAYSADANDLNDIHIINLKTFGTTVLNQFNKNKLLLVSQMGDYRMNWLVSIDCSEIVVWDIGLYLCEMRISLNFDSIIRANYIPEIRPDCFIVCNRNKSQRRIEGRLVFLEARKEDRCFHFLNIHTDSEEKEKGNESIYSISKDSKKGIKLKVFFIKGNNLLECNKIIKYSYVIPDRLID